MSAAGPSSRTVNRDAKEQFVEGASIRVIDATDEVARRLIASQRSEQFAEALGDGAPIGSMVGKGDVLDIIIWEAPPAALFGSAGGGGSIGVSGGIPSTTVGTMARGTTFPEQMVNVDGTVVIPFAGAIQAAGRTPRQIEQDIAAKLAGKAHKPQAIVRVVNNATSTVTVVGDVATSARVSLTARGERLLDVLASVGGVKQPVGKTTVQITRGNKIVSQPLDKVINEPSQNIRLQPDDVVTVLYQPYSFTALGATTRNEEIAFESTGITLAQALARVGGLQDSRSDVRGVFLFRLEDPSALDPALLAGARMTPDGKVPVIYRVDMKSPATFFVAQSFPVRNKDVLYVSNAPLADMQKFVNIVSSLVFPVITLQNSLND